MGKLRFIRALGVLSALSIALAASAGTSATDKSDTHEMRYVQIAAKNKIERTRISNLGMSIEAVRSDSVWGFAHDEAIKRIRASGFKVLGNFDYKVGRGGHGGLDFPPEDARFHNYPEMIQALRALVAANSDIARMQSIGKTVEGRDLWAININSTPAQLKTQRRTTADKPAAIFMGNHHAREHLSAEVPLMFAEHLLKNRREVRISKLLDTRDIWIIPMVNPDGVEYDIATARYQYWRKNRRDNKDGTFGVDLNRNYGFKWGTGGSDKDTSSEIYMGPEPFSEPETRAIRDFVISKPNTKVLLTFHTYSELILYPWGNTYDDIGNARDVAVFKKMATTMAQWNHYKPEQSSDLYITSGDTTDWAYGERGIFAFTFELSPSQWGPGGFYPGAGVIDRVFQANVNPCLYLLDAADDPYKVLEKTENRGFLANYVEPALPEELQ